MAAGDKVTGALVSAARGLAFQPGIADSPFNISISGTFVANAVIVRSMDNGTSWFPVAKPDLSGPLVVTAPFSFSAFASNAAELWAVSTLVADGGSWTSGSLSYQFDS